MEHRVKLVPGGGLDEQPECPDGEEHQRPTNDRGDGRVGDELETDLAQHDPDERLRPDQVYELRTNPTHDHDRDDHREEHQGTGHECRSDPAIP
jgi:hypothetical protein